MKTSTKIPWGLAVLVAAGVLFFWGATGDTGGATPPRETDETKAEVRSGRSSVSATEIAKAVRAAAQKDCGCGACAAKGCEPCRGKNCYYCVAKALVSKECGCGMCSGKGCAQCGPGCDVCKFHLAPLEEAKQGVAGP